MFLDILKHIILSRFFSLLRNVLGMIKFTQQDEIIL